MLNKLRSRRKLQLGLLVIVILIVALIQANNIRETRQAPIQIKNIESNGPDLVIQTLDISLDKRTIMISSTIANNGNIKASASETLFQIGKNNNQIHVQTPEIEPFGSVIVKGTFSFQGNPGEISAKAIADISDKIKESAEDNNGLQKEFFV